MFDRLLESRARRHKYASGAAASFTAHATLIAGAVIATTQVQVRQPDLPESIHAIYFPPRGTPVAPPLKRSGPDRVAALPAPIRIATPRLDLAGVSSTDLTPIVEGLGAPPFPISGSTSAPGGTSPVEPAGVFQENEVEKAASLVPGSVAPRYPEVLRSSGVEGSVVALFVVDEAGRAGVDSMRFARSDNRLFEDAVRAALRRMRFTPAEIGGRKVRQLVQMPFVFTLNR
jgi:protein TonB